MQHSTHPRRHDDASEVDRGAYNRAFSELGLEWYWDAGTYDRLKSCAGDKDCVAAFIETDCPHLLQAYDSGFPRRRRRERAPPPERSAAASSEERDAAPAQGVRVGRPAPELRARR